MSLDRDRVAAALPAYEVGGELGRGGWGVVLDGRHRHLGREVAIKQLPQALAGDPSVRARFVAEARLLASLDHPHIVPVFDYVESDGLCLLVMEKLPGGTVWHRFTSTGVTAEAACALVLATCAGLHAAHRKGILHRDVKPENLLFSAGGALKVTDFGIAKMLGGEEAMATRAGEIMGTPAYMAPEQIQAAALGPSTDVYATGVMLYELLSGSLPFPDVGGGLAILYQHVHEQPTPLTEVAPQVPAAVAAVVMRALATDPDQRHPTSEAFGVALAEAATEAWGPGWPVARGQTSIMGSASIVAATERRSLSPTGIAVAPAMVPVPSSTPMRATMVTQAGRGRPRVDDDGVILVSVRELVARPPFPTPLVAQSAGFLVAALLIGLSSLFGLGSPGHGGNLPAGALHVAGVDPAAHGTIGLDLAQLVPIDGRIPSGSPDAVRLALSMGGIEVASATGAAQGQPDGSFRSTVDLASGRYVAAGRTTGHLTLLRQGAVVGSGSFSVESSRPGILTLPGAIAIAAALFLAAYAESVLRVLRRGRRARTGVPTTVVLGVVLGADLALLGALMAGNEPSPLLLLLGGLAGGAAGRAAGRAGVAVGRFRRLARTQRAEHARTRSARR